MWDRTTVVIGMPDTNWVEGCRKIGLVATVREGVAIYSLRTR